MSGGDAGVLVGAISFGILVPWVGMKMLAPSLARGPLVENYRGRRVFAGLGIVWLFWGGAAAAVGVVAVSVGRSPAALVLVFVGPLALASFCFGLVDDAFGTRSDRGFRGHLAAAARGRLSTGGLKLLGISAASYAVAVAAYGTTPWTAQGTATRLALAVPAGAAIALTANFTNLTDLRPGRALKAYSVLAFAGFVLLATRSLLAAGESGVSGFVDTAALALWMIGPVVAVWRLDAGEVGMLGDAGANPAGAVAGALIVLGLGVWPMFAYLAVVLALNLASERVSFTRVIEASPLLHRLDMIGRKGTDGG